MPADLTQWKQHIDEARERVYELAVETSVVEFPLDGFPPALLKQEHLQKTGSFKLRGATNKILSLTPEQAARGVVTSSTGNHGLGVAAAARHRGIQAEIFLPPQVPPQKVAALEDYGASVTRVGNDPLEAEIAARHAATSSGRTYISPYNDAAVIAGQGTIAPELLRQVPRVDAVFVAVGGGGLISGIGAYLKTTSPETEVIGCWPRNSRVMYECLRVGRILEVPERYTLSESTAGGVEAGSITFELCQSVIDRSVLVGEDEILTALRHAHKHGFAIEGAAALAIAAFRQVAHEYQRKTAVIISCGGNPSPAVLSRI